MRMCPDRIGRPSWSTISWSNSLLKVVDHDRDHDPFRLFPPSPRRLGRERGDFASIFSVKHRVPSRLADRSGPATVRESVRTGPRPHRLIFSDPGPRLRRTLDLGFAGKCPVPTGNERPRPPARTPNDSAQALSSQPTAPSGGQRTPRFYASGNNSENSVDPKLDLRPRRKCLVDLRPSNARAEVVSPRWGSRGTELGRPEIPGLRCAPTWAIESRPVGAEETSHAADNSAFNARLKHAFC